MFQYFLYTLLSSFLWAQNLPDFKNLPSNGPIYPVSPIIPYNDQTYSDSVAHIHGYVEKPVEYYYKTLGVQPTVQNVPTINYVPGTLNFQGVASIPQVNQVQTVKYVPNVENVVKTKQVPVSQIIKQLTLKPKSYQTTEYSLVPQTREEQQIIYKPKSVTGYDVQYVPHEQLKTGVTNTLVEKYVQDYQLVPKTYTGTGVRFNIIQTPVTTITDVPKQYSLTNTRYVPITEQQLGLNLLPRDYIVKWYQPIAFPNLVTNKVVGQAYETPPVITELPGSPDTHPTISQVVTGTSVVTPLESFNGYPPNADFSKSPFPPQPSIISNAGDISQPPFGGPPGFASQQPFPRSANTIDTVTTGFQTGPNVPPFLNPNIPVTVNQGPTHLDLSQVGKVLPTPRQPIPNVGYGSLQPNRPTSAYLPPQTDPTYPPFPSGSVVDQRYIPVGPQTTYPGPSVQPPPLYPNTQGPYQPANLLDPTLVSKVQAWLADRNVDKSQLKAWLAQAQWQKLQGSQVDASHP